MYVYSCCTYGLYLWLFSRITPAMVSCPRNTCTMPNRGICCWIGLSSVLRPRQHSIGYMGDGFYRSKDPTNSNKVLKEMLQRTNQTTKTTKYTYAQTIIDTKKDIHKISTTIPLVYTNTGWLGDGSHRGQVRQAWTVVGLPPRYPLGICCRCVYACHSVCPLRFIHSFI